MLPRRNAPALGRIETREPTRSVRVGMRAGANGGGLTLAIVSLLIFYDIV
jgi:hypothetical protein